MYDLYMFGVHTHVKALHIVIRCDCLQMSYCASVCSVSLCGMCICSRLCYVHVHVTCGYGHICRKLATNSNEVVHVLYWIIVFIVINSSRECLTVF